MKFRRINDVLAFTASAANTNIEQMGDAMSYVGPVAAAAGVKFEETSAALGILASNAFQGERGGTALRGIFASLITPTARLSAFTEKYGVTLHDARGEMVPFEQILQQLNTAGVEAGDVMQLFGKRAGPGMLALLAEGSKGLKDFTTDLEGAGGAAQRMQDTQLEGLVGVWTEMTSAANNLRLVIGKELTPVFTAFGLGVRDTSRWLIENIELVVKVGKFLVITTGAWLAYKLAMGGAKIAQGLATSAVNIWTTRSALATAATTRLGTAAATAGGFMRALATSILGTGGLVAALAAIPVYAVVKIWKSKNEQLATLSGRLQDATVRHGLYNTRVTQAIQQGREVTAQEKEKLARLFRLMRGLQDETRALTEVGAATAEVNDVTNELIGTSENLIGTINELTETELAAAAAAVQIAQSKRMAIVSHIQRRREAERAAYIASVAAAQDAEAKEIGIANSKRRAIVEHVQQRRDAERKAFEQTAADAAEAAEKSSRAFKEFAGRIPSHFIDAFKGGGGFAGALKAVMVDAFSFAMDGVKSFLSGWASKAGGWLGKLLGGGIGGGGGGALGGIGGLGNIGTQFAGPAALLGGSGAAAGGAGAAATGGGAAGGGLFAGITASGLASAAIIAGAFAAPLILTWASESPAEAATNWVETWKTVNPEIHQLAVDAGNSVEIVSQAWHNVEASQGTTLAHAVRMTRTVEHLAGTMGDAWSEAMELAALDSEAALALVKEQSEITAASIEANYSKLPDSIAGAVKDPLWAIGNMLDNAFKPRTVKVDFKFDERGYRSGIKNLPNYDVPHLASGAIVRQPTRIVAGEAGPEAITTPEQLRQFAGLMARGGGGGQNVVIQIDGETIARAVIEHAPETEAWIAVDR